MERVLTFLFVAMTTIASAQTVTDFENFGLPVDSFLNGSTVNGVFTSGNIELINSYTSTPNFDFWSGWAISTDTDVTTPGFTNQYSAITGSGYSSSSTYATSYAFSPSTIRLTGAAQGGIVNGFYVTNATYTYLSIINGEGPAKKFGGPTGDDPDFLLLTIKKYKNGALTTDSVDFYLADYRFSDNTQDYAVNDWQYVDLTSLGDVDSLAFILTSSDNDVMFGMNTPAYFCIDNFETADYKVNTTTVDVPTFRIFPNPTSDFVVIEGIDKTIENGQIIISDAAGRVVYTEENINIADRKTLDVSHLVRGVYFIKVGNSTMKLMKN